MASIAIVLPTCAVCRDVAEEKDLEKPVEKLDPYLLKRIQDKQHEQAFESAEPEKAIEKLDPYLLQRIQDKQRDAQRVQASEQRSARPVSSLLPVGDLFDAGAEERARAKRTELRRALLVGAGAGSAARQTCCVACAERVYPAERLTADGFAFHRGCFRCFDCSCPLRLGAYVLLRDDALLPSFFCVPHGNARAFQRKSAASLDVESPALVALHENDKVSLCFDTQLHTDC